MENVILIVNEVRHVHGKCYINCQWSKTIVHGKCYINCQRSKTCSQTFVYI